MTVLSYQTIKLLSQDSSWDPEAEVQKGMIWPYSERGVQNGMSYGCSNCGYDIRVKLPDEKSKVMLAQGAFLLASSYERIKMPNDLVGIVHDKSSWARKGIALQNTVLEPGWEGFITLEITYHQLDYEILNDGDPIAQILFHRLDQPTAKPYTGKYQNQEDRPVEAIHEASGTRIR